MIRLEVLVDRQNASIPMPENYWIMPRDGQIEIRELSAAAIADLVERGFEYFIIGRGKWSPIQGYVENPADVGQLRRILNHQDSLSTKA
jgi:hypothetical protein